jgi:hypothetical protein
MAELESDIERLHRDFGQRLRALGAMFSDLGTDEGAARLLRSLVADDADEFHELIDRYDLPDFPTLGRCVWVREVMDSVLLTPNVDEVCTIASNLTPQQRLTLLAIARKHLVLLIEPLEGQAVAPGPFLDELKEHHLADCKQTSGHVKPLSLLGPYERFCV